LLRTSSQMSAPSVNWKNLAPHLVAGALLLWALFPSNPYGYYSVMRWIVCAIFIFLAVKSHEQSRSAWIWVWAVTAGIYNPVVPVHATRGFWSVVNVITIAVIIFSLFSNRTTEK